MINSKLIRNIVASGLTSLVLAGCSGEKPRVWTEAEVNKAVPHVRVPTQPSWWGYYPMKDLDGDGKIDIVYDGRRVLCLADGYDNLAGSKDLIIDKLDVVVLTPQMIEDLTQIAKSQKSFARNYLKAKGLYHNPDEYLDKKGEAKVGHLW